MTVSRKWGSQRQTSNISYSETPDSISTTYIRKILGSNPGLHCAPPPHYGTPAQNLKYILANAFESFDTLIFTFIHIHHSRPNNSTSTPNTNTLPYHQTLHNLSTTKQSIITLTLYPEQYHPSTNKPPRPFRSHTTSARINDTHAISSEDTKPLYIITQRHMTYLYINHFLSLSEEPASRIKRPAWRQSSTGMWRMEPRIYIPVG
jgi:hypothetical protein